MRHSVIIRSRFGNLLLAALGALSLLASMTLIGILLYSASIDEIVLEILLLACAAAGWWFLTTSVRNLRTHGR